MPCSYIYIFWILFHLVSLPLLSSRWSNKFFMDQPVIWPRDSDWECFAFTLEWLPLLHWRCWILQTTHANTSSPSTMCSLLLVPSNFWTSHAHSTDFSTWNTGELSYLPSPCPCSGVKVGRCGTPVEIVWCSQHKWAELTWVLQNRTVRWCSYSTVTLILPHCYWSGPSKEPSKIVSHLMPALVNSTDLS